MIPFIRSNSSQSCTFYGFRKVVPFPGTESIQLFYAAAPQNRNSYFVLRAALRKMTPQNYPMGSKTNSDGPQRTPVWPLRSLDAWIRGNYSHVSHTKNTVKALYYGRWTGSNLLRTYADGIISPKIFFMVHQSMGDSIYSKQFLPKSVYSTVPER